jgi:hypothetical protein
MTTMRCYPMARGYIEKYDLRETLGSQMQGIVRNEKPGHKTTWLTNAQLMYKHIFICPYLVLALSNRAIKPHAQY